MNLTERERTTVDYYQTNGREWVESHQSDRFWGDFFDRFSGLVGEGKILEIGCGGGRDAEELVDKHEYVGIDITRTMLNEAKKRHPDQNFIEANVYHLPFKSEEFDGFWAAAVLLHLEDIQDGLREIRRVTKKGGYGFIAVKKGEGHMVDDKGRYFRLYQRDELTEVMGDLGIKVKINEELSFGETTWMLFICEII